VDEALFAAIKKGSDDGLRTLSDDGLRTVSDDGLRTLSDDGLRNLAYIDPGLDKKINGSAYVNRLYRLFVAEFASALRAERNTAIREKLKRMVRKTKFTSPKSVGEFRHAVIELLTNFPHDLSVLRGVLVKAYAAASGDAVAAMLEAAVDETVFDFDHVTIHHLRSISGKDRAKRVIESVDALMRPRVELLDASSSAATDATADISETNIFVACAVDTSVSRPQCYGGKLLVPKDKFPALVDILSSDIMNKYTAATLSYSTAGAFDETTFIERPGELLTVRGGLGT
jgi:hypothetical protein